jgi:hypothetical protein
MISPNFRTKVVYHIVAFFLFCCFQFVFCVCVAFVVSFVVVLHFIGLHKKVLEFQAELCSSSTSMPVNCKLRFVHYLLLFTMLLSSKLFNVHAFNKLPTSALLRKSCLTKAMISSIRTHSVVTSSPPMLFPSMQLNMHSQRPFRRSFIRREKNTASKRVRDKDFPLLPQFFNHVRLKEFVKAKETYEFILVSHAHSPYNRKDMMSALLSLCEKGDQLEFALQLNEDLRNAGFVPTESDIYSLIKCASDKGDIKLAKRYLQDIIDAKFIVRHRDMFPIFQAIAAQPSANSSYEVMAECSLLKHYSLYPRPQELEIILASGVRTGAIKDSEFQEKLSDFISLMNHTHCAINYVSALRMHQVMHDGTIASEEKSSVDYLTQILKKGILVDKHQDITGKVQPTS